MKYVFLFLLPFVLISCSSIQVSCDYDGSVDFSKYKTYAFSEESLQLPLNQLNLERIIHAVENEMTLKGLKEEEEPDIAIDLHLKTAQRVEATATTTGTAYGPYRYGWGAGYSTTQINYDEYTDGTLFISIVEMETKKLIWQGIGTKTIDENMKPSKREESINYSIKQILANYPPSK